MKLNRLTVPLLIVVLFLASCGAPSVTILKGIVAGFQGLVAYEISQGHISAAKAATYTADANLLIDDYGQLSTAFSAAKTGAEKAAAIGVFVNQVLPIANDFAKIPRLAEAMVILNTTLAVVEAFYGGGAPKLAHGQVVHKPQSEKELKAFLDQQTKVLKAALAH